ncbi:MAG: acetyl-CoA C-acetyltransferase [Proteobacteria bacterium]|nr:acetyl-CoA C-acetyltransferase [Pseudomonadota bacterium]
MGEAYIFDAVRTPRGLGKSRGALYTVRPVELLATALRAITARNALDSALIEDVIIGCVTQTEEQGACIARWAVLEAGYDQRVPGVTVHRYCASGLEAINQAAARVAAGYAELLVAGGVESMSRVRMGADGGAQYDPALQWAVGSVPQGIAADLLATLRGLSRGDVDRFALQSQQRAAAARDAGRFNRSLVPVCDLNGLPLLEHDEHLRPETTLERLAQLKPAFAALGRHGALDALTRRAYPQLEAIDHVHTAGNASGIVDGAAAVLIGSRARGEALGLRPRARIVSAVSVGDDPVLMLWGPVPATRMALARAGLALEDIDLFEVNEAFAAVPLAYAQEFGLDLARINVDGGSIALGHPLGATGAILLGTLLEALETRGLQRGLVTLCIGGGMGTATVIERV